MRLKKYIFIAMSLPFLFGANYEDKMKSFSNPKNFHNNLLSPYTNKEKVKTIDDKNEVENPLNFPSHAEEEKYYKDSDRIEEDAKKKQAEQSFQIKGHTKQENCQIERKFTLCATCHEGQHKVYQNYIQEEIIENGCDLLSTNSNCSLYEDKTDTGDYFARDGQIFQNPLLIETCRTIKGIKLNIELCRQWWLRTQKYNCTTEDSEYNNALNLMIQGYPTELEIQDADASHLKFPIPEQETTLSCLIQKQGSTGKLEEELRTCIDGTCPLEEGEVQKGDCEVDDSFAKAMGNLKAANEIIHAAGTVKGACTSTCEQQCSDFECQIQCEEDCLTGSVRVFGGQKQECTAWQQGFEVVGANCCEEKSTNKYCHSYYNEDGELDILCNSFCKENDYHTVELASKDSQICEYIGVKNTHENIAGVFVKTQEKKIYCCYSSNVAYQIQSQGHEQIPISFGTPHNPNCGGLTLDEFKQIDFSKVSFPEVEKKFDLPKEELIEKVENYPEESNVEGGN